MIFRVLTVELDFGYFDISIVDQLHEEDLMFEIRVDCKRNQNAKGRKS